MSAAAPPRGVTGPIPRELFRLALPVLGSQLLRVAYQWVDALWVRGLGVEATAAVTTSMFVMWTVFSLGDVFTAGASAYVSQLLGAGERARAGRAAYDGLRAAAITGLACGVAAILGARHVYALMGATPGVVENGGRFLAILGGGAALPLVMFSCETVMRAAGNSRAPLAIDCAALGLNAALDPLLIYGIGPFPRMGVAGAATATLIAQALAVACYLTLAARRHPAFPLARTAPGPRVGAGRLARVGAPNALVGVMFSLVYVAFSRSAARYGAAALAIVGVANRIEAIQFLTAASIGIAGASLVGQNLGARRPERALQTLRTGVTWVTFTSLAFTAVLAVWPGAFVAMFTRDAEALRIGVPYLRILATCMLATGIEVTVAESILGSGHTRVLSILYNVVSLARIPLAFWAPGRLGEGVLGIAWLISITCIVRTVAIVAWALRGTWLSGLGVETRGAAATTNPDALA